MSDTPTMRQRLARVLWKHDYGGTDEFWEASVAPDSKEYHARRVDVILAEQAAIEREQEN